MTMPTLVFDMDGVLVEVTESYREAIAQTVAHFTGARITNEEIQEYKNSGGWNDDWQLSHHLVNKAGVAAEFPDVKKYFQSIFLGENGDGLIRYEQWMPRPGLLPELAEHCALAIFTGRAKFEADITLVRHAADIVFHPLVTDESVPNPKPAPDGLLAIQNAYPGKNIWYLGDTVDDARSALAAGVSFVGVSTPHNPRHQEITDILKQNGAFAVITNINDLAALVARSRTAAEAQHV